MEDLQKVIKRVDDIRQLAVKENTSPAVIEALEKTVAWMCGNRSMQEHGLCFAFMHYLHGVDGRWPGNFNLYLDQLKLVVGHCLCQVTEGIHDGERWRFEKWLLKSLQFGRCTQDEFHQFFDRVKQYAFEKHGIKFEEWFIEYTQGAVQ